MNSMERVFNAFNMKNVDRVPVIPQIIYAAASWINKNVTDCVDNPNMQFKALIKGYNECKYDGIYAGWSGSFSLLANAMGLDLKYTDMNPPSVVDPLIFELKDLEMFVKKNLNGGISFVNHKGINTNMELIRKLKSSVNDVPILSYLPGPFTYVGVIIGITKLMINVIRNPDFLKKAMDLIYEFILSLGILKIEAGVDCITIADPSSSSTMISPKNFQELGYPFLKKLIQGLKKEGNNGTKIGIHICGNTKPILSKIEEMKVDYFEIDSLVPISEAREILKNTCIIGNIAPSDIHQKSIIENEKLYLKCLEDLKGKGHILSSGCEVVYGTPLDNIKKMVSTSINYKF